MSTDRDLTPIVRAWLQARSVDRPDPSGLLKDVFEERPTTRQRRPWWPFRRYPLGLGATRRTGIDDHPQTRSRLGMFSATRFVVGAVVVALLGGLLLSSMWFDQRQGEVAAPASASASPIMPIDESVVPHELPNGVRSGTIDTPLGAARWVHLTGDATTLPNTSSPIRGPSGWVALDDTELSLGKVETSCEERPCRPQAVVWTSPDLISWTQHPLVLEDLDDGTIIFGDSLSFGNGAYWLLTDDRPNTLWRSTDAIEWEEIDLGGLVSPGPAALDWEVGLREPVFTASSTVVTVEYTPRDTARYLGLSTDAVPVGLKVRAPGIYSALGGFGEIARLRFEETATGLRVIDHAEGSVLAELDGVRLDLIERWATSGQQEYEVGVVLEGTLVVSDALGRWVSGGNPEPPQLFGPEAGLFAYLPVADGMTRVWRSIDGQAWIESDLLGDDPGEPTNVGEFQVDGGRLSIDPGTESSWESTDGTTWRRHPGAPGEHECSTGPDAAPCGEPVLDPDGFVGRIGSGWLVIDLGFSVSVLSDGGSSWVSVDVSEVASQEDGDGSYVMGRNEGVSAASVGPDTVMISVADGLRRNLFLFDFDTTGASTGASASHPFYAQADAICTEAGEQIAALGSPGMSGWRNVAEDDTWQEIAAHLETVIDIMAEARDRLRKLPTPQGDTGIGAFLSVVDGYVETASEVAAVLRAEDSGAWQDTFSSTFAADADVSSAARQVGLPRCAGLVVPA